MTTDEPYRWLEAVANRREYIRDQLKGATPVFAISRPEGVLLLGVGAGRSKVFEIYDRLGLAALGHPVDIEKVRQTLIETAHQEGFARAPEDVTLRRLLNFALGPALKTSFEQIFSAPLMVECVLAEVGASPGDDVLARVSFDGTHRLEHRGVVVVHTPSGDEAGAADWLAARLTTAPSLRAAAGLALRAWGALSAGSPFVPPAMDGPAPALGDRIVEGALLERAEGRRARYRELDPIDLL